MDDDAKCGGPDAGGVDMPWTSFPIVYDRTVGDDAETIRMEFDSAGQVRMTRDAGGFVSVTTWTDEQCLDLMHLIARGLTYAARERRQGWAA